MKNYSANYRRTTQPTSIKNVFDAITTYGHDEDFRPTSSDAFTATVSPPGSREKIVDMRKRIENGFPIWHEDDREDYDGLVAAIPPRVTD